MHDENGEGNDYFKCDFCRCAWSEDRPMVEGHHGSLICGPCLAVAYREVVLSDAGVGPHDGVGCVLCLQTNQTAHWQSPVEEGVVVCRECIERSAKTIEKDPETDWIRPQ